PTRGPGRWMHASTRRRIQAIGTREKQWKVGAFCRPLSSACGWCFGRDHHWQPERRAARPREGTPVDLLRIDLEVVRAGSVGREQRHQLTESFARQNVAAQLKGLLPGRRAFSTCRGPPTTGEP